jgi:hypothetical protein
LELELELELLAAGSCGEVGGHGGEREPFALFALFVLHSVPAELFLRAPVPSANRHSILPRLYHLLKLVPGLGMLLLQSQMCDFKLDLNFNSLETSWLF